MNRFRVISKSWLGKVRAAALVTGFLSLASLSASLPAVQGTPKSPQGNEPRQSSFPDIPTKTVQTPTDPGKTKASKKVIEPEPAKALEAQLYETTAEVGLRSIPNTEVPPAIESLLPKGTLLWLLAKEEGTAFTRASVLGGFTGYVHSKHCRLDDTGMVEVTGSNLAFRARPTTKGWPIDKCRRGTRLPLLAQEGEWYKVLSNPEVGALVPDSKIAKVASIQIKPGGELASFTPKSDLQKRAEAQFTARQAPWAEVREKRIAESKRRDQVLDLQQEVRDLRAKILAEREKGKPDAAGLAAIPLLFEATRKHVKAVEPPDAGLDQNLAAAEAEYVELLLFMKGLAMLEEKPGKPEPVRVSHATAKRGFSQSGWVRYRPGSYSDFQLVKGGEVLCYLVCGSRRYNLKDYVGCELGLFGPVGPREAADFKVLDVTKIHVLSSR